MPITPPAPAPSTPTVRVRRIPTTPEAVALLEQIDAEIAAAQERANLLIKGILVSHGITGPARITETAGTKTRPVLVIETPVPARRRTPIPPQPSPVEPPAPPADAPAGA